MKAVVSLLMFPLLLAVPGLGTDEDRSVSTVPIRTNPPVQRAPGDLIPPCYMVYGYGTDAQGKGPYLGASGNALPIGQAPRAVEVWQFRSPAAVTRKPSGAAPHSY